MHKRIKTTLAKAKELRPFAEKLATHSKKALEAKSSANVLKLLKKDLSLKSARELVKMAEHFKQRKGGYLRIIKLNPRPSDSTRMALIEWVDVKPQEKEEKPEKSSKTDKKKVKKTSKEDKKDKS